MNAALIEEVNAWIADDPDPVTAAHLQSLLDSGDEAALKPLFNGFLQFGTAGLRGPIGAGPSCMNRAVVGRTAAGLATYMKQRGMKKVVIGRDARHGSEDYTQESAEILSGAGMDVYILPRPLPTPVLAYATSSLRCDIGIMVTAVFALRQLTRSSGVHREYIPGEAQPQDDQIAVFRLDGALFFGAAERIFERLVSVAGVRVVILRMSGLQFLDATGAHVLVDVVDRLHDHGVDVIVKGIQPEHHGLVSRVGLPGSVPLCASLDEALTVARALVAAR